MHASARSLVDDASHDSEEDALRRIEYARKIDKSIFSTERIGNGDLSSLYSATVLCRRLSCIFLLYSGSFSLAYFLPARNSVIPEDSGKIPAHSG